WGLLALLACYALVRRARQGPRESLFLTLSLGLSPWFVHLAFSYMSDVPWMALMLFAMLTLARADRGQPAWLVLSVLAVGAAGRSRQLAVVTVPAFLLVIALDARAAVPPEDGVWRKKALARAALFLLPVTLLCGAFFLWYTFVHHPTAANRENWQ